MRPIRPARSTATTTIEVIQEFCHVRARRRDRTDAAALARSYALVSADVAFAQVVDPHHLDPAAPDFAKQLARLD